MKRIIIVENEIDARENLKSILGYLDFNFQIVGEAENVEDGIKLVNEFKPDLLFLDIELDGGTSFEILDQISLKNVHVIFITGYDKYAIKAFKYSAVDYILKPFDEDDIVAAIEKYQKRIDVFGGVNIQALIDNVSTKEDKPKYLVVNSQKSIERFSVDQIVCCEAYKNYTTFYLLNNDKIVASKTLKEYEDLLEESQFVRVHRSFIVNKDFIKKLDKDDGGFLILENQIKVPVSQRKRDLVLNTIFK